MKIMYFRNSDLYEEVENESTSKEQKDHAVKKGQFQGRVRS